MEDKKLGQLLGTVIDQYIDKGDPIGSKSLHALEGMEYAPSTLRKYLNLLEKSGLVYQPYNSSGRIPTVQGLSQYIDELMIKSDDFEDLHFEVEYSRNSLRYVTETLGKMVDGVVVGFLKNDEYYYLGVNNLLANSESQDMHTTKAIIQFLEDKKIMSVLDTKMLKNGRVYYTFIDDDTGVKAISCLYTRISVNQYDGIVCILGPMRVNYKKNLAILKKLLAKMG